MKIIILISTAILLFTYIQNHIKYNQAENCGIDNNPVVSEWQQDSLQLENVLKEALMHADENGILNNFSTEYKVNIGDKFDVLVKIDLSYHFSIQYPHLIIRRKTPEDLYIDIYAKDNNTFEKVVSHVQWILTYINDTIQDINGDGLNDFVVNGYGANGCCLKAFSNIYLIRNDKKSFSGNFEFMNPAFSPEDHVVRGICYGHPGETEMYKYKWNGEKTDTLEYVSYEKNNSGEKTGKVIVANSNNPYLDDYKILKLLDDVPEEYKAIKGYHWFTGEFR